MSGEERVFGKWDPLEFFFGSLGAAWARLQRDSHRLCDSFLNVVKCTQHSLKMVKLSLLFSFLTDHIDIDP